jgi:poly(3-hydroxybutyrate) depolymerase
MKHSKHITLIVLANCLLITGIAASDPVKKTIRFGGFEREYLVYTPQHPQSAKPAGILIGLHGFNGSMNDFFDEYDFRPIANSLNCLILAPQALPEQNGTVKRKAEMLNMLMTSKLQLDAVWACGLKVKATAIIIGTLIDDELNKDIDDVGFISLMIQQILDEYALPAENVFMVGTSMGGYMAYQYALKQPIKLAGMVSVAGSMGLAIKGQDAGLQVPVCDFHSLTDEVVPYTGSYNQSGATIYLAQSKTDVIQYWVSNNGAGAPVTESVNYYPSANTITVEKTTYPAPVNEVIHYRMSGASHTYFFKKENGDCMDFRAEITRFITSHATGLPTNNYHIQPSLPIVYPNPAYDIIYFGTETGDIRIFNMAGQTVWSGTFRSGSLNIAFLPSGTYILHIQVDGKTQTTRIVKK